MSTLNLWDTGILTTKGSVAIQDLQVGTPVLSPDGRSSPVTRVFREYRKAITVKPLRGMPFVVPVDEVFVMSTFSSKSAMWRKFGDLENIMMPLTILRACGSYKKRTLFLMRGLYDRDLEDLALTNYTIYGIENKRKPTALATRLIAFTPNLDEAYRMQRIFRGKNLYAWVYQSPPPPVGGEKVVDTTGRSCTWCVEAYGDFSPVFGFSQKGDVVLTGPKKDLSRFDKSPISDFCDAGRLCFYGFETRNNRPYMTADQIIRSSVNP